MSHPSPSLSDQEPSPQVPDGANKICLIRNQSSRLARLSLSEPKFVSFGTHPQVKSFAHKALPNP